MPVICIVLLAVIYIQIQHYLPQIRTFYIFWQMSLVIRVWLDHPNLSLIVHCSQFSKYPPRTLQHQSGPSRIRETLLHPALTFSYSVAAPGL